MYVTELIPFKNQCQLWATVTLNIWSGSLSETWLTTNVRQLCFPHLKNQALLKAWLREDRSLKAWDVIHRYNDDGLRGAGFFCDCGRKVFKTEQPTFFAPVRFFSIEWKVWFVPYSVSCRASVRFRSTFWASLWFAASENGRTVESRFERNAFSHLIVICHTISVVAAPFARCDILSEWHLTEEPARFKNGKDEEFAWSSSILSGNH